MEARNVAFQVLRQVEEEGAYANLVLDDYLKEPGLNALDRAFVTELVYGTVKYRQKLDWVINQMVAKAGKLEIGPRVLLRMAFYQLLQLEKVPDSAVTNEAVKTAKKFFHRGVATLVNGVLRNYLRQPSRIIWPDFRKDPASYLEVLYSHPRWMVERWLVRYGFDNTRLLCEFNNRPADLWIRTNTLRVDRPTLMDRLVKEGCEPEASGRIPEGIRLLKSRPLHQLPSFREGLFTVQDESSMLVGHLVQPEPGGAVVDLCAGPGGKTTHLAQLMGNKGTILAFDVHEHRLALVEENARRLGIDIVRTRLQDATKQEPWGEGRYEHILVDAPCSGLGVLRRRPDSRWRKKPGDLAELQKIQRAILGNAAQALKPGGRLVYSTCTLEPEENELMIERLLQERPDLKSLDLTPFMPYCARTAEETSAWSEGRYQYLPFRDGMEGFFVALLEKTGL